MVLTPLAHMHMMSATASELLDRALTRHRHSVCHGCNNMHASPLHGTNSSQTG
jgi:hypothetical protein